MNPCLFDLELSPSYYFDGNGKLKNYGYGFFTQVENCEIKQVLSAQGFSGEYTLSMTISLNDRLAEKTEPGKAILSVPDFAQQTPQIFVIRTIKITETTMEISADHIKYVFFNNMVSGEGKPVLYPHNHNASVPDIYANLIADGELVLPNYFNVVAIGEQITTQIDVGSESRSVGDMFEAEQDGFFAKTKCELSFNNFSVLVHKDGTLGDETPRHVISYGTNISSYAQEMSNVDEYTHLLAFAKVETLDSYTGDEKEIFLYASPVAISTDKFLRLLTVDYTDYFSSLKSEQYKVNPNNGLHYQDVRDKLAELCNDYKIRHPELASPTVNINVDYEPALDTLDKIKLGDRVRVLYDPMNYNKVHRVTEIVFDPINRKYKSVTIGERKYTLYNFIKRATQNKTRFV